MSDQCQGPSQHYDAPDDLIADRAGLAIIAFLHLRQNADGRVMTAWHTKSPAGIARSIERILNDAKHGEVVV